MSTATVGHRRRWWIAGMVAAAVIVAVVVTVVVTASGNAATEITLIRSSTPGPNPFTQSVASGTPVTAPSVQQKSALLRKTLPVVKDTHTPVATGTTPGLYGGSGDARVCDPQQLVTYLQANPGKAAAWAGVLGIRSKDIAGYVASLTPVILNSDTLVGNHGYSKGSATSLVSVLQAGTAVMVDATGTPRVKCNCGNPLTPPQPLAVASSRVVGSPWAGYAPGGVIAVRPGKTVDRLTLVDLTSGDVYSQAVGPVTPIWAAASWSSSTGTSIVDQTDISTSADGASWSPAALIPHELVAGIAWGNGRWVAVTLPPVFDVPQSDILTSTDLRTWKKVASVPGQLNGVAFGGDHWEAVGDAPAGSTGPQATAGGAGIVYSSSNGSDWRPVATVMDTIASGLTGFASIGYGDGRWMAVAGNAITPPVMVFSSADGETWVHQSSAALAGQTGAAISFGSGTWLIDANTYAPPDPTTFNPSPTDGIADTSTDGTSWQDGPAAGLEQRRVEAVGYGSGHWLAGTQESFLPNPMHSAIVSRIVSSSDGTSWSTVGSIDGPMGAIAYGTVPAGASHGTPSPSATASATPSPAPTAASGAAPDCSVEKLQAALTSAHHDGTVDAHPLCSGEWATAAILLPQAEVTGVFEWANGSWSVKDRESVCAQNLVPAALVQLACHSN